MNAWFSLQYQMTLRRFREAGLPALTGFLLVLLVFTGLSFYLFAQTPYAPCIYLLMAVFLMVRLAARARHTFIDLCFGSKRARYIRMTENLLVALPFMIFLAIRGLLAYIPFLLLAAVLLAWLRLKTKNTLVVPTPFSRRPFEFAVGFRKTWPFLLGAYALVPLAVYVQNMGVGIFALLLVFAVLLSYYGKPEHEYYVWVYARTARGFLHEKLRTAFFHALLPTLPVLAVLLVLYPAAAAYLLLFYLGAYAFLITTVLAKYTAYPNEMDISHAVLLALCLYFPPLLLAVAPYFYARAVQQLKQKLS